MHYEKDLRIYQKNWSLLDPLHLMSTTSADIFRVYYKSHTAVLKILLPEVSTTESEGFAVLEYFNGKGAATLYRYDSRACLMEWLDGETLKVWRQSRTDRAATEVACSVVASLHECKARPSSLKRLGDHFKSLFRKELEVGVGSIFRDASLLAKALIEQEGEMCVLHGDIHHENIVFSSSRGWLAIDAKGIVGERTFDVANIFYNPLDEAESLSDQALIRERLTTISRKLFMDPGRVLDFAFVYGCLSAVWMEEDNINSDQTLRIAKAIRDLRRSIS